MNVIVTGAGNGLGRALAAACRDRGDVVLAVDSDGDALAQVEGVTPLMLDLLDPSAPDELVAALTEPCSAIFHSAGISGTGPFEAIPADHHARVLALNFAAPMQITRALLAADACAPDARHVFVGSVSTFTGYPGATSYAASKDGLASFARSLDKGLPHAMTSHCVFPGPLRTDHAARYSPDNSAAAVRRRQHPDDTAKVILRKLERGRSRIFPTRIATGMAAVGTVLPGLMDRVMTRALFDKLTTSRL